MLTGFKMPGETRSYLLPHCLGKDMALARFNERGKIPVGAFLFIHRFNALQSLLNKFHRTALVFFPEIQMKGPWRNEGCNFRSIAIFFPSGYKIGKTMQKVFRFNGIIGWQAAVSNNAFKPGLQRTNQP